MSAPDTRRLLPRTDRVLADERLRALRGSLGHDRVKRAVVQELDRLRASPTHLEAADAAAVADAVVQRLQRAGMRPVINATGVVLHTNLGRAPLSRAAVAAVVAAAGYVDVEYDLDTGLRAKRGRAALAALRTAVPDAEAVHIANNGAAALLLAVTVLAAGREVVVSRGELVEIGDGFRLPDLIVTTGARLREVGTTNRTSLADYADAVGPETGCILKVHPSNFSITGFTRAVETRELARLGAPVIVDVGSGLLTPDAALPEEPDVTSALRAGATVVTCSGDKLLGGPQAGLVFGQAYVVTAVARHPLARAVRVDKLTLAAIEATVDGPPTPTAVAVHADADALRDRCARLAAHLNGIDCSVVPADGVVGGGGAPGVPLPGWAVALPASYAERLRTGERPVIARVERDLCLVDLRCVDPRDDADVADAIRAVTSGGA